MTIEISVRMKCIIKGLHCPVNYLLYCMGLWKVHNCIYSVIVKVSIRLWKVHNCI